MGWLRSSVEKRTSADEVFEYWCDTMDEIPERAQEANGLTDFGTVKNEEEGRQLLLDKEDKIVGVGFVKVEAENPFYLTLTNAYVG